VRIALLSLTIFLAVASAADARVLGARVLARGDHGWDVTTLQRVLVLDGFSPGHTDGWFGRRTLRAVRRFQRARGLTVDGRVGPVTTHELAHRWNLWTASWYGPGLWGNKTACGRVLRRNLRGVAHRTLPCGTRMAVYANGRIAIFPVIDRGPHTNGVSLDLTRAAAKRLRVNHTTSVRAGW
jgi:rare lipoprotein A (peptidoglycan hydrolase)